LFAISGFYYTPPIKIVKGDGERVNCYHKLMSFVLALVLYVLFLAVYWFFVLSILWHVKEYSMPQDSSKWIILAFIGVIIFLNITSLALFFSLPLP